MTEMSLAEILSIGDAGTTFLFAILVYWEVRTLRNTIAPILFRLDERVNHGDK